MTGSIHEPTPSDPASAGPDALRSKGVLHCGTGNLFGGVETHLLTLALNPSDSPDWADRFVLGWDARIADSLRKAGHPPTISGPARISRPWTILRNRRFLDRLLNGNRPRIVVFHSAWTHALQGPVVRRHGIPSALFLHSCLPRDSMLEKWARRTPLDGVAANSQFTSDSATEWFPGHPIPHVLRLPVSTPVPTPGSRERLRAALDASATTKVILQACRITRGKGLETLLRSLCALREHSGWECWIAGAPDSDEDRRLLEALRSIAVEGRIDHRIRWLGFRSDIPDVLGAADIFCQVNDLPEAFGLSVVEAMLSGLPVVGPTHGGIVETLKPAGSPLVAPGDHVELASALLRLLEHPDRLADLADRGRSVALIRHEPISRIAELRNWFRQVATKGPATPPSRAQ